ncbi:MAG: inorganic phosphate transporter [Gammaproteobacteria bacterium]|nr:inorganic phosphate transporter [Gammaproteobacteria bacterium]
MNEQLAGVWILVALLAWANGANDVAKGVATLVGGRLASARLAVLWGTVWTAGGGIAAILWGSKLVSAFSHGYLAPDFDVDLVFVAGSLVGAASWVLLASRLALPVSTTHALLGGLVGAALSTGGWQTLHLAAVTNRALVPLLISPLLAVMLCGLLAPTVRGSVAVYTRYRSDRSPRDYQSLQESAWLWMVLHWFSGAVTSFARGLNDVPKIAAFLVLSLSITSASGAESVMIAPSMTAVTLIMAAGGLWGGFRVLHVLAHRITSLDATGGFVANAATSALVLMASPLGLPVSTTHVSTGALLGVRLSGGGKPAVADALMNVLWGWLITLPFSAMVSAITICAVRTV